MSQDWCEKLPADIDDVTDALEAYIQAKSKYEDDRASHERDDWRLAKQRDEAKRELGTALDEYIDARIARHLGQPA